MDEHGVTRLATMNRNQLDASSTNRCLRGVIDRYIRLEAAHPGEAEAFAEKVLGERSLAVELAVDLLLIVASGIEPRSGIKSTKISMAPYVIPVRVRYEDRGQVGKVGRVGTQSFVGNLG